jgi:hypothetical protein
MDLIGALVDLIEASPRASSWSANCSPASSDAIRPKRTDAPTGPTETRPRKVDGDDSSRRRDARDFSRTTQLGDGTRAISPERRSSATGRARFLLDDTARRRGAQNFSVTTQLGDEARAISPGRHSSATGRAKLLGDDAARRRGAQNFSVTTHAGAGARLCSTHCGDATPLAGVAGAPPGLRALRRAERRPQGRDPGQPVERSGGGLGRHRAGDSPADRRLTGAV